MKTGADILCSTLGGFGVDAVFGLPGTQNLALFDALRRSSLRTVVASHELGAGFMANGYARVSGQVGVVCSIPGPGFTYALTALAEARHDSVPLVLITGTPAEEKGRRFHFQSLDQRAMAAPVVKAAIRIDHADQMASCLGEAFAAAASGEPGPVLVEVTPVGLAGSADECQPGSVRFVPDAAAAASAAGQIRTRLAGAIRPLLLVGQGAAAGARALHRLAEALACPVATTLSGRGILAEDHVLNLCHDMAGGGLHILNEAIASADLVLALGCKFSHNGTGGFRLSLPRERLVHVDASPDVAGANYPASLACVADVPEVLSLLAADPPGLSRWTRAEITALRARGARSRDPGSIEPRIGGVIPATPAGFFEALREALPRDAVLITDSGLHQTLARRHWQVLEPRSFITPSDFQSMGFGIPAAIGAAVACPGRPVVVLTGDGGFAMAGLELLTAVREAVPLTVVVFNDGQYGLIRFQQMRDYGRTHGVGITSPDFAGLAAALGAGYRLVDGHLGADVASALRQPRPVIIEVAVGDSLDVARLQARSVARETVRGLLPAGLVRWLKRL